MVLEHRLRAGTNKALECGVWCSFHSLKRWFLFLTAFEYCELNHFGETFYQVYRQMEQKILTKLNSIRDEIGK